MSDYDKDKEAFEKWKESHIISVVGLTEEEARKKLQIEIAPGKEWQAACEYKQKEIDELYKHLKDENDLYKNDLKFYEAENEKLKDVLVEISQETRVIEGVECSTNGAMIAAEALKELGEK